MDLSILSMFGIDGLILQSSVITLTPLITQIVNFIKNEYKSYLSKELPKIAIVIITELIGVFLALNLSLLSGADIKTVIASGLVAGVLSNIYYDFKNARSSTDGDLNQKKEV